MSTTPIITLTAEPTPVTVFFNSNVIASTTEALQLREGDYPPVLYVPIKHVATEFLIPTDRRTTCPHKGEARYWTISAGGSAAENAVWGYETPKTAVAAIAGHVAFYADKVRFEMG